MTTTSKLDTLKAAFAQTKTGGFNNYFQFWRAPVDSTSIFRFLPDADESNPMQFLVENITHELQIDGQKKRVPCLKMYGESCPVCQHSSELYDAKNEAEGKKYYRKLSYIGQGIVLDSPVEHDQEILVKLVDFGPKIYKVMQSAFQSGDLEKEPYDFFEGYNFRFKVTANGEWNDYSTSSFAPKQSALPEDMIEKIELLNLKDHRQRYIPRAEIETLLLAARTGGSMPASTPAPAASSAATTTSTPAADTDAPAPEEAKPASTSNTSVLAQLRARAKAKQEENGTDE